MFPASRAHVVAAAGCLLLAGCTADDYARQADEEVSGILLDADREALTDRGSWVILPDAAPDEDEDLDVLHPTDVGGEQDGIIDGEPAVVLEFDLDKALEQAFRTSPEYLTRTETLYLEGVGLSLTRFDFGPQINATISGIFDNAEDGPRVRRVGGDFSVSQILATGGTFSILGSLDATRLRSMGSGSPATDSYDSNIDFNLNQPLLQGAGYEPSHEPLIQAERDIIYEVRDFELFRQGFAISIARDYFDLVSQLQRLENERQNYGFAVFDKEKSEALLLVDRATYEDVFLARRREVDAENQVLVAEVDYETNLETFEIRLGMPDNVNIRIQEVSPPYTPVRLEADSAVRAALHNRLDLINAAGQVEDAERRVRVAKNGLLPMLDLDLGYGQSSSEDEFSKAFPKDWDVSAGLSLEIPIQRTPERNAYRRSLIAWEQEQRDYQVLLEETERDVRDSLRQIRRIEQQIVLAVGLIESEERAVAVTQIRYEAGDAENRDLLDARQSLVDAQNGLVDLQVSHFIARLVLYRDLGLFFIDSNGSWRP